MKVFLIFFCESTSFFCVRNIRQNGAYSTIYSYKKKNYVQDLWTIIIKIFLKWRYCHLFTHSSYFHKTKNLKDHVLVGIGDSKIRLDCVENSLHYRTHTGNWNPLTYKKDRTARTNIYHYNSKRLIHFTLSVPFWLDWYLPTHRSVNIFKAPWKNILCNFWPTYFKLLWLV